MICASVSALLLWHPISLTPLHVSVLPIRLSPSGEAAKVCDSLLY